MVNSKLNMPLTDFESIIGRLKEASGVNSDQGLADALGISRQNIGIARRKGEVPPGWLIKISEISSYSMDWIYRGVGVKRLIDATPEASPEGATLDHELLKNIIQYVEVGLEKRDLLMDPDKKAQAVSLLYELYADTQKEVTEETVVRYLKLVA